jgi:hypothetical protein
MCAVSLLLYYSRLILSLLQSLCVQSGISREDIESARRGDDSAIPTQAVEGALEGEERA